MKETQGEVAQIERHPDSPMVMIVAGNGARALMVSEAEPQAIEAAGPGKEFWSPTWYAFDVEGPGLDLNGVPTTLEAAVEARRKMREREPVRPLLTHPDARVPAWCATMRSVHDSKG